ncbi:heat shock protein GrpE [Candidatus Phytoplasma solani]|uniref:nucleotide exchange factor GrpE n=1 Tax=Candidatus Phytoplasma solani TaxID=69896 RepID=UPI0032DB24DD
MFLETKEEINVSENNKENNLEQKNQPLETQEQLNQENQKDEKKKSEKSVFKLEKQISKLKFQTEQQKKEFDDELLKKQAELINFKKRLHQQKAQEVKYASGNLISNLLLPLEQLEKVLEFSTDNELLKKYLSGFQMIQQQIKNILQEEGVEEIKALNVIFDPALHHALETISDPQKPNKTNLKVLQKGYLYKEKILRPAMVQVNEWSDKNGKN